MRSSKGSAAGKSRARSPGWLGGGDSGCLDEINLIVHSVVVVPELLTVDIVANTNEHSLAVQVDLIIQLDFERKPVMSIVSMLPTNIMAEYRDYFGRSPPVIKRETSSHVFVEGKVSHSHGANQNLLIGRQKHTFQLNWKIGRRWKFLGGV